MIQIRCDIQFRTAGVPKRKQNKKKKKGGGGHRGCPPKSMLRPSDDIGGNKSECIWPILGHRGRTPKMMLGPSDVVGGNNSE